MAGRMWAIICVGGWMLAANSPRTAAAGSLAEEPADLRVFEVVTHAVTRGKLVTPESAGKTRDLPIESTADFQYRERRLPPAGRDASAFRAVREFDLAKMQARIAGEETQLSLPASQRLIIADGASQGILSYAVDSLLTRDLVDLLEIPADPLALLSALPPSAAAVGDEWTLPEWSAQMLAGIEAVESARVSGRVQSIEGDRVTLRLNGAVQGLHEGVKTHVALEGDLVFDQSARCLVSARMTSTIRAEIGAVAPGIDAVVSVQMDRRPSSRAGRINDALVESIALDAPPAALRLAFDAAPWNVRLRHDRSWYVFHAVFDAPPKVVILRLVENGSLICQCNLSPIPDAAPGTHTPIADYERDIHSVLGKSFRSFVRQQETPLSEGRTLVEVVAEGEVELTGKNAQGETLTQSVPMEWRYYIIADPRGRQMSFVFALEKSLSAQLGQRDRELAASLEFLAPR